MDIHFEITPGNGIRAQSPCRIDKQQTDFETCWSLAERAGSGTLRKICLRPGFDLYIADYRVKESLVTHFESGRPAVGVGFWLSGATRSNSAARPLKDGPRKGDSPIFYFPDQTGRVTDLKNSHRRSVSLLVEPRLLHTFFRGRLNAVSRDVKRLVDGREGFSQNGRISSMMFQALDLLFNCPLTGPARHLFMEAKAMELLALRLGQLTFQKKGRSCPRNLGPEDIQKINTAAARLCVDLENPPSLPQLAASVGISHAKLNRGFRQLHGTTAFGYLRKTRLARAKTLLEQDRLNVTETALAVGYNSLSSFARAFCAQHGCNPYECKKSSPA